MKLQNIRKTKEYDIIAVGTGSAMNIVTAYLENNPEARVAVIDKDEPGGICLTRGCIPSKLLLYPAEVVATIDSAKAFGISANIRNIDFASVMRRMRDIIDSEIGTIRKGLTSSPNVDYYHDVAEFVEPYTMKIGEHTIRARTILLCTGSAIAIPNIKGLESINYLTSDSVLFLKRLPSSVCIVGGGYIAAEYGHFFSSMGSEVTVIGRNRRILPGEEPEISELARRNLSSRMRVMTNCEVTAVTSENGLKRIEYMNKSDKSPGSVSAEEIMIASGRRSNSHILHPERSGIETAPEGWIRVNEYLETTQPGIWAFGDANGKHLFKHVANYESIIVYYNAILGRKISADYHAVPHAVFTMPEVAGVGMSESEATAVHGKENILIGFKKYEDTAKGQAMNVHDCFVKIIMLASDHSILGAHIIGPQASVLIQEVTNLMYTSHGNADTISHAMHIHPSLTEVVQRAVQAHTSVDEYHRLLRATFSPPLV